DLDLAGSLVYIDDADISPKWKRQVWRIIIIDGFQSGFEARRHVGICGKSNFLDRLCLVRRALDVEFARLPFQILFAHLHQVSCDLFRFLSYLSSSNGSRCSGNRSATACIGTQAIGRSVGVSFLDSDASHWDSKFLRYYLSKRCLVPLSLRLCSKPCRRFAGRMDPDLAAVEHFQTGYVVCVGGARAHNFGEARYADPHQLAFLPLLGLLLEQILIANLLEGQLHGRL